MLIKLVRPQSLSRRTGHVLVFTLAILALMFVLTGVALALVKSEGYTSHRSYAVKQARSIAEGGIDYAIRQLNAGNAYTGSSDVALGEGTFTVIVTGSGGTRTVESIGYIPNSANPLVKRKIIVDARLAGDNAQFFYGVQVDAGGLTLNNNAGITGNVYSNGDIIGAPGAYATGDVAVAGGINDTPTLTWETNNSDQEFASSNDNRDIAQSFVAPASDKLTKVAMLLATVGSPTDILAVRLLNDNNGSPGSTALASGSVTSVIGSSASWISVSFSTSPTLVSGTKYWLLLDSSSASTTDHWNWRRDSSDGYANNTGKYTNNWNTGSTTWTGVSGDLAFRLWIGGFSTKIKDLTIGSATSGTATANVFEGTKVHGSNCPNAYCIIGNPPAEQLPISDGVIQDWKNEAIAGGSQGSYTLSGGSGLLGPKKIVGDLTVGNGGILKMTGALYVTGNVNLSNNCQINLDPNFGTSSGVITVDGTVVVSNNCVFTGAGTGSYVILLTTKDAKNEVSMTISNNSAGVIYYAGKTRISFANNSYAREATAWGIDLANNVVISYETGLSSIFFSGGPGAGWGVKSGTWREVANF